MARRRLSLCVFLLMLFALPVNATQMVALDLATLANDSRDIVVGRVLEQRAHWNAQHTRIVTDVVVAVDEALKGGDDGNGTLTLTQLGGVVDGARYSVPGVPTFQRGEEVLLFVWRDARGRAQVNGLAQGKFEIRTDAATGEKLVQREFPGLAVKDLTTLAAADGSRPAPRFRLSELKANIAQALRTNGGTER